MQFKLASDKAALKAMAADFLARECDLDFARRHDEAGAFPADLYRKLGELGWLGIPFAAEYGGSEGDPLDEAIILEELGRAMGPLASAFLISMLTCGKTIRDLGTPEQRARWLPPAITGEAMLAFALTEPQAGSDAVALRTRAVRDGAGWILNGQKIFCTGATLASQLLVMARTDTGSATGRPAISIFVVDTGQPGLTITPIPKLGLHPYPSCMIFLDDVRLPADALLGDLGGGWPHVVTSLNRERLAISAMCTGMAQAALDVAVRYIGERQQFGHPLADFEAIQGHVAGMAAAIAAARTLSMRAAWLEAAGRPSTRAASMAKVRSTEAAVDAARLGMQVLGGYSYTMEYPMQRFLRDALIHPIAGGSNEIQRNIIARDLELSVAEPNAPGAGTAEEGRDAESAVTKKDLILDEAGATSILESARRPGGKPEALVSALLKQFLAPAAVGLSAPSLTAAGQATVVAGGDEDQVTAGLILPYWTGDSHQPMSLNCARAEAGLHIDGVGAALATGAPADRAWLVAAAPGTTPACGYLLEVATPRPGRTAWVTEPYTPLRLAGMAVPEQAVLRSLDHDQLTTLGDLVRLAAAAILIGHIDEFSNAIVAGARDKAAAAGDRWAAQGDKHRAVDIAMHRDTGWLHLRKALTEFDKPDDRGMLSALALTEAAAGLQEAIAERRRLARLSGDEAALTAACLARDRHDFWVDLAGGIGALTRTIFARCVSGMKSAPSCH